MTALSLFPARIRFTNADGTLTTEGLRALWALTERVGGSLGTVGTDTFSVDTFSASEERRHVASISADHVIGWVGDVDHVYLATGTITVTLPSATGNKNRYTVKNAGVGVVSIETTGGQTIDATAAPIQIQTADRSLDLISDGTNWRII